MVIKKICAFALFSGFVISSCTKKEIQFGNTLGESNTRLIETDTVAINMSTYVLDSFATNNLDDLLFGRYNDSAFGKITAKPFVQLSTPGAGLESGAVYDSLTFILKLNKYYYGDTSITQTIVINELSAPIDYTYNSSLYNNSSIEEKPVPLGSRYVTISPNRTDSVVIRLSDVKGLELFNKLTQSSQDIQTNEAFLKYFRGVSIGFSSSDVSAIYGVKKKTDSIFMRLHYHTTIPYLQKKWKDFSFYSNIDFNRIVADKSSAKLPSLVKREISADALDHHGYTQSSAGVLLKMAFPTLRNILQIDPTVKLLNATLVMNVAPGSYDGKLKLPSSLTLYSTDATNNIGSPFYNSAGNSMLSSSPIIDNIYSTNTYYSFDVTSSINSLLTTAGSEEKGFYLIENTPGSKGTIDRAIFNDSKTTNRSRLILSLLTLKD